ncbi:hypothetical protein ACFSQ7_50315 [Paenibacillus rhizoplanae]
MLIAGFTLAGCAGNNGNTAAPTEKAGESTTAPAATKEATGTEASGTEVPGALEPVELSLYLPGGPDKDVASVEQEINAYLKDKINATIKINQLSWDKPADKVNLMIQSGEVFDMVYTWNFMTNAAKGGVSAAGGAAGHLCQGDEGTDQSGLPAGSYRQRTFVCGSN